MKRVTIVPKLAGIVLMSLALAQVPLARADTLPNFTGLVKENSAAVVNISTTQKVATTRQGLEQQMFPDVPKDSPFYEFFKRFFQNQPTIHNILTAAHVVDHADSVVVQLSDHSEKKAKVVGKDDRTDVALLKIDAHNLPTVSIGDSSKLEVGQWVLAIPMRLTFPSSRPTWLSIPATRGGPCST